MPTALDKQTADLSSDDWMDEDGGGQLAIDAYQTDDAVILKAPIAGVNPEDLEVSVGDGVVSIKGERRVSETVSREHYFVQECYWGTFTRSYVLPTSVDSENADAQLKNGILTIIIPKLSKAKARRLTVKTR